MKNIFLQIVSIFILFTSCTEPEHSPEDEKAYEGPLLEAYDIRTIFSDSAKKQVVLNAKVQFELQNKDREFPEGVFVEFFDANEKISSTLEGNYAYFYAEKNLYEVRGDVKVNNIEKAENLQTEELFWEPLKQQVHTEKFVRITTPEEILMGEGLTAKDDFSSYKILKPTGIFAIEE